jgi:hypothetical protein
MVALILALAISVQQVVYIGIGVPALTKMMVNGCSVMAQIILPSNDLPVHRLLADWS